MSLQRLRVFCVLLLLPLAGMASPLPFADAHQEARFHALAGELRCVQCHNQSLADSDALIAQDMRRQVLEQMQQGKSDAEIKTWLVQRYGEFVLYRPALHGHTLWLWMAPLLMLCGGGVLVWRTVRRRPGALASCSDDAEGPSW